MRLQRAYAHANRGDELMTEQKVELALEEYNAASRLALEIVELPFWHAVMRRFDRTDPAAETVIGKGDQKLGPTCPAFALRASAGPPKPWRRREGRPLQH